MIKSDFVFVSNAASKARINIYRLYMILLLLLTKIIIINTTGPKIESEVSK